MTVDRRRFIGLGSFALGAALVPVGGLQGAATPPDLFSDSDSAFSLVRKYSDNFAVIGTSVLARLRGKTLSPLRVLAQIRSLNDLTAALAGARIAGLRADGNLLELSADGAELSVENLTAGDFAARMKARAEPTGVTFAHDGLAFFPRTRSLQDPFGGKAGALQLVNKDLVGPAALDETLRGLIEASQLGLSEGASFAQWKRLIFGWEASGEFALRYARSFLRPLAILADQLSPENVETMVRSHLVSAALTKAVGIDGPAAVAAYRQFRSSAGRQAANSALWLAAILEPQIRSDPTGGEALFWLDGAPRAQVAHSRAALLEARKILGV
jgi:hypothetical protein